jgi:uncharacterized membrane protein YdjX (TVP38/TMEM64 family)
VSAESPSIPAKNARRLVLLRVAAVLVVASMGVLAWRFGLLERLSEPETFGRDLVALGAWGYLAFVICYALVQPFGVPGTVFVVAASLIWPWPIAFALSMVGTMAASTVGFSFARFMARDFVAKRIPARFRKYDEALEKRAFTTVVLLRFVFWMPPLLHAFFGVSKVRFWTHFWGSFVGYLIPLFVMSFFGRKLVDAMKNAPPSVWIGLVAVVVVAVVSTWAIRRARRRARGQVV